jgi:hypothetical protein
MNVAQNDFISENVFQAEVSGHPIDVVVER